MIAVINRLEVPQALAAEVERGFAQGSHMEGVAGCLSFRFMRVQAGGSPHDGGNRTGDETGTGAVEGPGSETGTGAVEGPGSASQTFLVYTEWTDRSAFEAWVASPHFMRAHASSAGCDVAAIVSHTELAEVLAVFPQG